MSFFEAIGLCIFRIEDVYPSVLVGDSKQRFVVAGGDAEGRGVLRELVVVFGSSVEVGRVVLPRCAVVPSQATFDSQYASKGSRQLPCSASQGLESSDGLREDRGRRLVELGSVLEDGEGRRSGIFVALGGR